MLNDVLKKRFAKGEVLFGPFIDSDSADLIEILGLGGFDFAIMDCEHSPTDPSEALHLLRAAEVRNLPILIRVNNDLPSTILKMMDIGASGVMVPLVHTPEQAKRAAQSAKYHPIGRRGTALMRASDYSYLTLDQYFKKTNSDAFVMVQAESKEAIDNLKGIAAIEEIDSVFIGPYDLSQSLGIPGQFENPLIKDILKSAPKIIRAAGKIPGIIAGDYEGAQRVVDWGYQLIAYSTDLSLFKGAVNDTVKNLKKIKTH